MDIIISVTAAIFKPDLVDHLKLDHIMPSFQGTCVMRGIVRDMLSEAGFGWGKEVRKLGLACWH